MLEFLEERPGTPQWDFQSDDENAGQTRRNRKNKKKQSIDAMDGIVMAGG